MTVTLQLIHITILYHIKFIPSLILFKHHHQNPTPKLKHISDTILLLAASSDTLNLVIAERYLFF